MISVLKLGNATLGVDLVFGLCVVAQFGDEAPRWVPFSSLDEGEQRKVRRIVDGHPLLPCLGEAAVRELRTA